MSNLISATLVWDSGADRIEIPERLLPSHPSNPMIPVNEAQQFQGTILEKLCEIAGRACYDSFGKGRTSESFHKHILEVGHLSVLEHATFTLNFALRRTEHAYELAAHFLNRPTVFVRMMSPYSLQVTLNLRHIMEWEQGSHPSLLCDPQDSAALGPILRSLAATIAPQIVRVVPAPSGVCMLGDTTISIIPHPSDENQQWASLLLTGSRGFSHEQVRHGDWSAISQRSTRYVDESESEWVEHPLMRLYRHEKDLPKLGTDALQQAKAEYVRSVLLLEPWLISRGVDKGTARKQARGAARGWLGNALYTEMVFSASIAQWKRMIRARMNPAADAEIRAVYVEALAALKQSRFGAQFEGMTTIPSPDGIGLVLSEG